MYIFFWETDQVVIGKKNLYIGEQTGKSQRALQYNI